jgi:uncharacterized protein YqeY
MLRTELSQSLKDAMRAKDVPAVSTVRLILAALKDRDIAARGDGNADGVSDEEILQLLQKMIKQRQESIKMYEEGGRVELAAQEQSEIEIINRFLPQQLSDAEIEAEVEKVIGEIGAASVKDMGRLMGELRERYAGQMDFGKASGIAKARLMG